MHDAYMHHSHMHRSHMQEACGKALGFKESGMVLEMRIFMAYLNTGERKCWYHRPEARGCSNTAKKASKNCLC